MHEELLNPSSWSLGTWLGVVGVVLGLVTFIAGIVYQDQIKRAYFGVGSFISRIWGQIGFTAGRDQIKQLKIQLQTITKERDEATLLCAKMDKEYIQFVKATDQRWNQITKVKYGYLRFEPFLEMQPHGVPGGPGVDLLKYLLNDMNDPDVELINYKETRDWSSIFQGLHDEEYRVVATPLFATFERSKLVRFTSPLFYSNVGLYVNSDLNSKRFKNNKVTSEEFKRDIQQSTDLELLSINSEISQTLARKYLKDNPNKDALMVNYNSSVAPGSLFETIFNGQDENVVHGRCAMFCDSFYASLQPRVRSGEVVNVFHDREILYPVCYAVRQGDYQLANLINLRLLQFPKFDPRKQKQSILEFTAELVAGLPRYKDFKLDPGEVMRHFVDEWPCPVKIKDTAHA